MRYIAALDYEHLDNGVFLTSLARSVAQQKNVRSIIVHGDSAYTERIMQTGVMRDEARIRSIKDLNHRLIALFADQGISAIGINGHQRKFITINDNQLSLDASFFERLADQSVLLLSTLVLDLKSTLPEPIELPRMASFLQSELKAEAIFSFSKSDKDELLVKNNPGQLDWNNLPKGFAKEHLPAEFQHFDRPLRLAGARNFHQPAKADHSILIR